MPTHAAIMHRDSGVLAKKGEFGRDFQLLGVFFLHIGDSWILAVLMSISPECRAINVDFGCYL